MRVLDVYMLTDRPCQVRLVLPLLCEGYAGNQKLKDLDVGAMSDTRLRDNVRECMSGA